LATESELREKVATACRILAQHGLVKGSTGHVSARVPGREEIVVRGRPRVDRGLRFAEPDSIINVDLEGRVVGDPGEVKRVGEIYIHTELYKRRPEVNAVIHAHPPGVLLCTMTGLTLRPIFGGYEPSGMKMAIEGLPVYGRTITLHTLDETLPFVDVMGNRDLCLMRAHGIAVAGRSVEDATHKAIVLESLARLNWYASLRGVAVPEVAQEDREVWAERARVAEREGGAERDDAASWTYYLALLEQGALQFDDTALGFGAR
jgi:ribulose-5-phosphate 4-epimerase/fuculose-1-phosphate aldolase